jgi:hypothetical protein
MVPFIPWMIGMEAGQSAMAMSMPGLKNAFVASGNIIAGNNPG